MAEPLPVPTVASTFITAALLPSKEDAAELLPPKEDAPELL